MIIPAPSDVAFTIFSFPVYRYGITMACAILAAMIFGNILYNKVNPFQKKDVILEYAPWIIICGILGARLYFCLLNFHYYFTHPIELLDIRQGGLSIHGAIICGVLSMICIARKLKIPVMTIMDSMACATILGQSIGRWGNYFNSEAYGLPVASQAWGLYIPPAKRVAQYANFNLFHPTFLYESVLDFAAFFLLMFILLKFGKKYRGLTFFAYLCVYSVIRFIIEQLRVDSALNIGALPVAQLVSTILFVIGTVGIFIVVQRHK